MSQTPKRYQSGEIDAAGRVAKCGDGMVRGLLFVVPYIEHVPPDVGAIKMWLCNRRPKEWAEKQTQTHEFGEQARQLLEWIAKGGPTT